MKLLSGHVSPETAYTVDDYPYGFRLRCTIRYWLEHKPGLGFRFVSQTSNPKQGGRWNKPKAGTYAKFGAAMYLDDNGHVKWSVLNEYTSGAEAEAWAKTYGEGVPESGKRLLARWVAAKLAYDANRSKDDPLDKGLPEARAAFNADKPHVKLSDIPQAGTKAEAVYREARENGATGAEAIAAAKESGK